MEAENNYESDLSESWSLIDINLNEESFITTDASPALEKRYLPLLKNFKSGKINKNDFKNKYKVKEMNSSQISDSESASDLDSDSDLPFKNQNMETCNKIKEVQHSESLDGDCKNDSGDAESIEILEVDGNYQDSEIGRLDASIIDHFKLFTYHSGNEESSDERVHNESRSGSSTVIKRKRRRVNKDIDNTVNCFYSENACMNSTKRVTEEFNKAKNHPVYKHYRNNVANKVLSLSVGIIFAGVACIAIGHFLGVQDAAETAVELVETLKKLQMENAALQSSVINLKKALQTLEMNSKVELPLDQTYNEVSGKETTKFTPMNARTQANEELRRSTLDSAEWVYKLQNIVKKGTEIESRRTDRNRLGKHTHDQLNLFKERKKDGAKFSEEIDLLLVLKKLLIVLKKIINRLSSSHDNIEVMHERLIKLKQTINHNFNKIFRNYLRGTQQKNRMPASKLKSKTIHWTSDYKIRWNNEGSLGLKDFYKFPQPQKYCNVKTYLKKKSSNNSLHNDKIYRRVRKSIKQYIGKKNERNMKKKIELKNWRKKKEIRFKKKDKKLKCAFGKKLEKKESENIIFANSLPLFNESISSYKKKQKKSAKPKKVLLWKLKKESNLKKNYVPFCSETQCFNLTGYWVFKLADGREEFRRNQILSDWQFERAKARKKLRNEDFGGYWQFKRALGRERNRNDYRTHREKFTKPSGKEFFKDRFSWI